jgi:hypothetical protein
MEKDLQRRLLRDKEGMQSKFKWHESLVPDLLITKAKRIEEIIIMHVWLSGIKALLDTNSCILDRVFYLNKDKMTLTFKMVFLTFFKQCVFLDI